MSLTFSVYCIKNVSCHPLPCTRLSLARTTMVTPLPWGSPPLGNPAIRQKYTYRVSLRFLVRPFIRTHCALFHCKKLLVQNQQQRAYNDIGINRFPMGDALHQVGTKVQAV